MNIAAYTRILFTSDEHSAIEPAQDSTFFAEAKEIPSLWNQIKAKVLDKTSYLGGIARRIEYIDVVRSLCRGTLVLSAGDFLEGTLWYRAYKGSFDVDMMNQAGYDAVTIGNHDFSVGWESLKKLIEQARFAALSANIFEIDPLTQQPKETPIANPYKIFEVEEGHKVAVIGVMGEDAWMGISQKLRPNLHFEAPEKILPSLLEKLRPSVDYIILLSHSGIRADRELAQNFPQIDAILGGHSHTLMSEAEKIGKTLVFHPYARGRIIGKLELKGNQVETGVEILDTAWDPKLSKTAREVQALIDSRRDEVYSAFKEIIAHCPELVSGEGKNDRNTDLGRVLSEVVRTADPEADIAFTLSGSFKGKMLDQGPLTLKRVTELLPHDGDVMTVRVNGAWIEKMMEENERRWGKARQFQYSGIEWTPEGLMIQGKPLVKDQIYTVRSAAFFFEREIFGKDQKLLPELKSGDPSAPSVESAEIHPDRMEDMYIKGFQNLGEISPPMAALYS